MSRQRLIGKQDRCLFFGRERLALPLPGIPSLVRGQPQEISFNGIGCAGPLSVEWEDGRMDREYGAVQACAFVKKLNLKPSGVKFDAAFERK